MGNEWPVVRLGNYVDACLGKMLDKEKNKGRPHKYLGNKSVRWGSFDLDNLSEMLFEEREHERYEIKSGDLIICEGGEPGRCAIWKEDVPNMKIQKALHRVRAKKGLENLYLYYWFLCSGRNGSLEQYFTGTTIKHFTGKALSSVEIPLPPVSIQKRIGRLLSSLDNKIQLNRETNKTLEAMAQALFKSWFVDFDPVIDNALAAGNKIPEPFQARAARKARAAENSSASTAAQNNPTALAGLPKAQRELFPSEFEETEALGWVPKGWGVGLTSDIATTNEISWTKKNAPLDVNYVDLANAKNGRIQETTSYSYDEAPSRAKRCLSIGDTIIGLVRPGNRSFAYISVSGLTGSTGFAVMRPKNINLQAYLYFHLTRDDVIDEFARLADGAAYPAIRPEVVSNLECIMPSAELLHEFQQVAGNLLEKIGFNVEEVKVLESLRDTLLPKLISGELRLPDAEKQAEQQLNQPSEALAK